VRIILYLIASAKQQGCCYEQEGGDVAQRSWRDLLE
jgi:hypothetical protein